jgi:polyphenol oxidase
LDSQRGAGAADTLPASIFAAMGQIMATSNTALFMGSNDPDGQNGGRIENGPHGAVHVWTGDPTLQNAAQDMGVLATAARDPVFFAHHCNIDRLWDVWVNATAAHQNPSSSDWLTHRWTFYDENSQYRSISIADVVSPEQSLRYTYREESTVPQAVHTFAIVPPTAKLPLGPAPATHTADLPEDLRGLAATASALPAAAPRKAFVLHIDGVEAPVGATATVRVFVNKPGANPKTPLDAPNYLGEFTLLPATSKPRTRNQERPHPKNLVFDVSPHVAALLKDKQQIAVTLVPTTANNQQPEDRKITYQKIYLTVEK